MLPSWRPHWLANVCRVATYQRMQLAGRERDAQVSAKRRNTHVLRGASRLAASALVLRAEQLPRAAGIEVPALEDGGERTLNGRCATPRPSESRPRLPRVGLHERCRRIGDDLACTLLDGCERGLLVAELRVERRPDIGRRLPSRRRRTRRRDRRSGPTRHGVRDSLRSFACAGSFNTRRRASRRPPAN